MVNVFRYVNQELQFLIKEFRNNLLYVMGNREFIFGLNCNIIKIMDNRIYVINVYMYDDFLYVYIYCYFFVKYI